MLAQWDLIARDKFDVMGGIEKTPASVGAVSVSIMDILQTTTKYGSAGAGGSYSVPAKLLGTSEVNSAGEAGVGQCRGRGLGLWPRPKESSCSLPTTNLFSRRSLPFEKKHPLDSACQNPNDIFSRLKC